MVNVDSPEAYWSYQKCGLLRHEKKEIIITIFQAWPRPFMARFQHHFTQHDTFTFSQCSLRF